MAEWVRGAFPATYLNIKRAIQAGHTVNRGTSVEKLRTEPGTTEYRSNDASPSQVVLCLRRKKRQDVACMETGNSKR